STRATGCSCRGWTGRASSVRASTTGTGASWGTRSRSTRATRNAAARGSAQRGGTTGPHGAGEPSGKEEGVSSSRPLYDDRHDFLAGEDERPAVRIPVALAPPR